MLFKLSLRNIQRSIRDYTVYFITLLLAVTIFYAFNSINDQQVMKEILESGRINIVELTGYLINLFSIVIALVLGFLVIYSNQLLVARRKREFGTYLTLGMKPGQVSRILLYETVFVGLLSLAGGIALGILVSQFLSFATAGLLGVALPNYQFEFSMTALIATLACFVAIYVVVAVFNVISIRRRKLIDLINANKKSQKIIIRNPWICFVIFVVSIAMLAYAYQQLWENGMTLMADDEFKRATVFMLIGTLLLFFSLSGLVTAILTNAKTLYYRKLRPFTTRQITSKVNSSFASIWIVCVLLFFAITTFATGMALVDVFMKDVREANPYDASIILSQAVADSRNDSKESFDITEAEAFLQDNLPEWDKLVQESSTLTFYGLPTTTYGDVMDATGANVSTSSGYIQEQQLDVMKLSQFNEALRLQGKQPITLSNGEYLVTNSMSVSEELADSMAKQGYELETPLGTLTPVDKVYQVQLTDFSMLSNGATLVLPDTVFDSITPDPGDVISYVNVSFKPDSDAAQSFSEVVYDSGLVGISSVLTCQEMIEQSMGMRMLITYLALYIGLVLLVAVAAVLAIQLLSLTIDSLNRYQTLNRLGCDMRALGRSLFAQVLLYFALPLAIAVCHSAWTIHILSKTLFEAFGLDLLPTILMSAALVLVIYGGYMLVTYATSKATVKQAIS